MNSGMNQHQTNHATTVQIIGMGIDEQLSERKTSCLRYYGNSEEAFGIFSHHKNVSGKEVFLLQDQFIAIKQGGTIWTK